jgi:hypothetical protein
MSTEERWQDMLAEVEGWYADLTWDEYEDSAKAELERWRVALAEGNGAS